MPWEALGVCSFCGGGPIPTIMGEEQCRRCEGRGGERYRHLIPGGVLILRPESEQEECDWSAEASFAAPDLPAYSDLIAARWQQTQLPTVLWSPSGVVWGSLELAMEALEWVVE